MKGTPLSVVLSLLVKDNQILLIKRIRGDYAGLWSIPGGKIETDEHISDAAEREVLEETGIKSELKKYLGVVSEHLIEGEKISKHFLLHICEMGSETADIANGSEGEAMWFDVDMIRDMKDKIIPSDFLIIEMVVKGRGDIYCECVLEKIGDEHLLRVFKEF